MVNAVLDEKADTDSIAASLHTISILLQPISIYDTSWHLSIKSTVIMNNSVISFSVIFHSASSCYF